MRSAPEAPLRARVLGGGPTGALAALALADAGWVVELCDPLGAEALGSRRRAYAFTHSSRRLLERLGLWQALEPELVPFASLRLLDAGLRRWLRFGPADLPSSCQGEGLPVGWIGRHSSVMALLLARLERHPAVSLRLGPLFATPVSAAATFAAAASLGAAPAALSAGRSTLAGSRTSEGGDVDLIVAADGPASPSREALGIGSWGWSYAQSCLTAEVDLRGAAAGTAWELLRPEGPTALLPLGSGRFQLVWSAPAERHRRREALDPAAFLDALAPLLPEALEVDALHEPPRAFPVALRLARRLSHGRTVLVGESAHRCHPVGGQGLNLCWRDVAVLHRLAGRAAAGRLAPGRLAPAYGRRRWADLLLILIGTDLLVRLFSTRHPLALLLRRPALELLAVSAPLRRIVLAVMTDGLPALRRA